jgi:ion channel-forming bestrophin family protein
MGVYYEDLYHLVRPLHEVVSFLDYLYSLLKLCSQHFHEDDHSHQDHDVPDAAQVLSPTKLHPHLPRIHHSKPTPAASSSTNLPATSNPTIPAINAYGTFDPNQQSGPGARPASRQSTASSGISENRPLLPSALPNKGPGIISSISKDLIPFESIFSFVTRIFGGIFRREPKLELPVNEVNMSNVPTSFVS